MERSWNELIAEPKYKAIAQRIYDIQNRIAAAERISPYHQKTHLLLATKTRTPDEINFAIRCGVTRIGENRVQELLEKYDAIQKKGVEIHFIGTLQTNKVKYIIDKVDMIESLDRLSLAQEIEKQAARRGIIMKVLVEINIGGEASKSGIKPEEAKGFIRSLARFQHIKVCGLMSIPPVLESEAVQKEYFQKIMDLYIDISAEKMDNSDMAVLSIGMSSDFELATACGSTQVRIGTLAFGQRNYNNN